MTARWCPSWETAAAAAGGRAGGQVGFRQVLRTAQRLRAGAEHQPGTPNLFSLCSRHAGCLQGPLTPRPAEPGRPQASPQPQPLSSTAQRTVADEKLGAARFFLGEDAATGRPSFTSSSSCSTCNATKRAGGWASRAGATPQLTPHKQAWALWKWARQTLQPAPPRAPLPAARLPLAPRGPHQLLGVRQREPLDEHGIQLNAGYGTAVRARRRRRVEQTGNVAGRVTEPLASLPSPLSTEGAWGAMVKWPSTHSWPHRGREPSVRACGAPGARGPSSSGPPRAQRTAQAARNAGSRAVHRGRRVLTLQAWPALCPLAWGQPPGRCCPSAYRPVSPS